jgi:hypothetical protein
MGTTDVKFLGRATQSVVELLDEIPANLVLADIAAGAGLLSGSRLLRLALLEINITVCSHGCCCDVVVCYEKRLRNRGTIRDAAVAPLADENRQSMEEMAGYCSR